MKSHFVKLGDRQNNPQALEAWSQGDSPGHHQHGPAIGTRLPLLAQTMAAIGWCELGGCPGPTPGSANHQLHDQGEPWTAPKRATDSDTIMTANHDGVSSCLRRGLQDAGSRQYGPSVVSCPARNLLADMPTTTRAQLDPRTLWHAKRERNALEWARDPAQHAPVAATTRTATENAVTTRPGPRTWEAGGLRSDDSSKGGRCLCDTAAAAAAATRRRSYDEDWIPSLCRCRRRPAAAAAIAIADGSSDAGNAATVPQALHGSHRRQVPLMPTTAGGRRWAQLLLNHTSFKFEPWLGPGAARSPGPRLAGRRAQKMPASTRTNALQKLCKNVEASRVHSTVITASLRPGLHAPIGPNDSERFRFSFSLHKLHTHPTNA